MIRRLLPILALLLCMACNSVSKDPAKGAKQLNDKLTTLVSENNQEEMNTLLAKYWDAYKDTDRIEFILALRSELMSNDKVVNKLIEEDYSKYPMYGTYLKELQKIAYTEALSSLDDVAKTLDSMKYVGSPASKGILFGSLLANYASTDNQEEALKLIDSMYNKLKDSSALTRLEFYTSFQSFIKDSGEPGIAAFNFIQRLDSPNLIRFMRLGLESMVDYD